MKRTLLLGSDLRDLPADLWSSQSSEVLIIKRWADERPREAQWISEHLPVLPSHVWLASSGTLSTAGVSKWVALSKDAILASASAVNTHLGATKQESWGLTLPLAHVGGLGIVARAHLLGQKISTPLQGKWDPSVLEGWRGELLSLVPTQVHDLIKKGIKPPPELRVVVVGGDRLAPELLALGRELGWPLFPSYGLTECCSQVATALPGDVDCATLLPHITASTDLEGRLTISSPSLFTGVAKIDHETMDYQERTSTSWSTDDIAVITAEKKLRILGRRDSMIKVRGEKVELPQLEAQLQSKESSLVLLALPDERDGHALWVVSERDLSLEQINLGLLPHQKLRGIKVIASVPRNALGKVKRAELTAWLLKHF